MRNPLNSSLQAEDPPLRYLLFGFLFFLGGIAIGGDMWMSNGSSLGGLILLFGIIAGPVLIAYGYS